MLSFIVNLIKGLVTREAARLYGYGGAVLVAVALWVAKLVNVELPAEVVTGVQALGVLIVTELIRRFVFSQQTVANIVEAQSVMAQTSAEDLPLA